MMSPHTETELAEIIRNTRLPLSIQGGGTRGVPANASVVSTANLSGITLYEPGALTLVAQAGTPVAEIEETLATEKQRLAFEPMDHKGLLGTSGTPTLGGVVAANVSGPRRIQVGAARDFALGVRFVDGTGTVIKNGGRVMKNVTGYDLVKLMSGSWGKLGVLTEVSLKVLPIPETETTLLVPSETASHAVDVMTKALASPYDVSGAAYDPATKQVSVRLEGFEGSVAYRAASLTKHLACDTAAADDSAALWREIRDVAVFHNEPGDVWRVSVKPTDGPTVIDAVRPDGALMDWSGGLVWLRVQAGTDVRARLNAISGHATLVRADANTRAKLAMFEPETLAIAALTSGLRAKFDPNGLFNPGSAPLKAA